MSYYAAIAAQACSRHATNMQALMITSQSFLTDVTSRSSCRPALNGELSCPCGYRQWLHQTT